MTEDKNDLNKEEDMDRSTGSEYKHIHRSHYYWGGSESWIWGFVLIIAGGLLMLRNYTDINFINLHNWWAVFILVPGISKLVNAFNRARSGGSVGRQAFGGGILVLLGLSFLFAIDMSLIWPLFLILGGVGLLFKAF